MCYNKSTHATPRSLAMRKVLSCLEFVIYSSSQEPINQARINDSNKLNLGESL